MILIYFIFKQKGKLYSWGENENECLGFQSQTNQTTPIIIPKLENIHIISVDCGNFHVIALDGE